MKEETIDALEEMNELLQTIGVEEVKPRQPDEFSVSDLVESTGQPERTISGKLKMALAEGQLSRRKHGKAYLYRKNTPKS